MAMNPQSITPLGGAAAWHGTTLQRSQDWVWAWSAECIEDLHRALTDAQRSGVDWQQSSRESFPLSCAGDTLVRAAAFLENGPGLLKLTGLPVHRYTREQLKLLFYGMGCWLGRPVYQSARGELLGEICDEGAQVGAKRGQMVDRDGTVFHSSRARAQSSAPLRWHTDRTDVVGLLCVSTSARGGVSRIVSAVAVHDEMVRRRPDLAAVLYQDLERSHLGEEAGGADLTYSIPVWGVRDGKFATHYSRTYVEAAQKLERVKKLSALQWEALDMLAALGDELCIEMEFEPGDIQLINNHVVYHARSAFEDGDESGHRRLLYRLWLSMPNSRALPAGYEVLFGTTAPGALRGGIRQADASRSVHRD